MKRLRPGAMLAAAILGIGLAALPAASANAVPSPPVSTTAVATTSSSAELGWGLPCSGCDPDRFEIQSGAPAAAWTVSTIRPGYIGAGYSYLQTTDPANRLVYTPTLPHAGSWTVQYSIPNSNTNLVVTSTTIEIAHAAGTSTYVMNQKANPGSGWQTMGTFTFAAGTAGSVKITNTGSGGTVVMADAFRFVDAATSTTVTVDDPAASNVNWMAAGSTPGDERAFTVGHLLASSPYAFRVRAVTAGVASDWVATPGITTPAKNSVVRSTVIAPTGTGNARNGEGDLLELSDGRLLYTYARYETNDDFAPAAIAAKTSSDGGLTWSSTSILFGTVGSGQTRIQPSLVRIDDDTIGMGFTIQTDTPTVAASRVFTTSDDDGVTWSTPVPMSDGSSAIITAANSRLVRLDSGRLLQVVNLRLPTASDRSTGIYTSDDDGATWTNRTSTPITGPAGFIESTIVELAPDELLLLGRTLTGAGGFLYESRSTDGGETWSASVRTDVLQTNAPAYLQKLPGGGIVLLTNGDTPENIRGILASRISSDGGRTWSNYRQIEYKNPKIASYPALIFAEDGAHLVFSEVIGAANASHLALPANWFTTVSAYPYAPSTIAHVDGATVTFTPVSGGQGTVSANPRVTVDGIPVTVTGGRIVVASGTHVVAWSSIDSASREEAWQSVTVTV